MTRIRANCPTCGDVEIVPAEVSLHIEHDAGSLVADHSRYRFTCPRCTSVVSKPATARVAQLLSSGGVEIEHRDVAEVVDALMPPHPEVVATGPALTYDDLLDLHLALRGDGWFEELVAGVRST